MDMDNFTPAEETANFETDTFRKFIRQRRSHRNFKSEKIPRENLDELIDTCRYSPTGGNFQAVEIMVVEDTGMIKRLSNHSVDFFKQAGELSLEKLGEIEASGKQVAERKLLELRMQVQYGMGLSAARDAGYDPIFYKAPAVVIFHCPTGAISAKDDCVIASTTMGLTARTMGLEFTYIGMLETASKMSEPIINELELPEGNEIFSVIIVGSPKFKYALTVDRKPIKTQWK
jgi:nitroreductase